MDKALTQEASPQLPFCHLFATNTNLPPMASCMITCKASRRESFSKLIGREGKITIAQLCKKCHGSWFALCNSTYMCACLQWYLSSPSHYPYPAPFTHFALIEGSFFFFQRLLLHPFNYLFWWEAIRWIVKRLQCVCVCMYVCMRAWDRRNRWTESSTRSV